VILDCRFQKLECDIKGRDPMGAARRNTPRKTEYPSTDGKPFAESDWHREVMMALIQMLDYWFADALDVYTSGNLLVYYVPGDKHKRVSPDVFVVVGVRKKNRPYFLAWDEGKTPAVVIEVTSKTTKKEDLLKRRLYQDVLKVKEFFLFDPLGDYLEPRLQGYQLRKNGFVSIDPLDGRVPSSVLNLHLEADGTNLRLYNPRTKTWLMTPHERAELANRTAAAASRAPRTEVGMRRLRDEFEQMRLMIAGCKGSA
jgi:Uma2 family endonuclease